MHIGFCNLRLESTTRVVSDRPGVKKRMLLARAFVTRYSKSSQEADLLDGMCRTVILPNALTIVQDVETRWWFTFAVVNHLLCLENAIRLLVQVDKICALLSSADWTILCLLKPVMEPFMTTAPSF